MNGLIFFFLLIAFSFQSNRGLWKMAHGDMLRLLALPNWQNPKRYIYIYKREKSNKSSHFLNNTTFISSHMIGNIGHNQSGSIRFVASLVFCRYQRGHGSATILYIRGSVPVPFPSHAVWPIWILCWLRSSLFTYPCANQTGKTYSLN